MGPLTKNKFLPVLMFLAVLIIVLAPLSGIYFTRNPILPYLKFPPKPVITSHAPFSALAFAGICLFTVFFILPFLKKGFSFKPEQRCVKKTPMPWWGHFSFACLAVFWVLAWSRLEWFASFQRHTFFPLWLSWIVFINALVYKKKGSCHMTASPKKFAALFVCSAMFWWIFEYLNRFVGNWYYSGSTYPAATYFFLATLSFSTVLPAVESMKSYLMTFPRFGQAFKHMPAIRHANSSPAAAFLIVICSILLSMIGIFPDIFFPLIWICPFFILLGCLVLSGRSHVFSIVADGDHTIIAVYASAALICGFFWEMFNFYSLARWQYSIPYVGRFHLFEMPVLGYAGYLPFGLECALIISLVMGKD